MENKLYKPYKLENSVITEKFEYVFTVIPSDSNY